MQRGSTRIQVTDADRVADYGAAYVLLVTCRCGHTREMVRALAAWHLAPDATIGQLRARLRCAKCAGRMPQIAVFRRQRD